jgi:hypothetical protein
VTGVKGGLCVVLLSCAVVSACAGSGSKSTASHVTTTTLSAEDRRWIAAKRDGILTDPDTPARVTSKDATCLAEALVENVTVARFKAAGVTISEVHSASHLPDISLPKETEQRLGAALQGCGLGQLLAPDFAQAIGPHLGGEAAAKRQGRCIGSALDSARHSALLAALILEQARNTTLEIADIVSRCTDWAATLQKGFKFTLSTPERACLNQKISNDATITETIASGVSGKGRVRDLDMVVQTRLGQLVPPCLSPQHLRQFTYNPTVA